MAVISIDVADVKSLRRAFNQRVGDLHAAQARVRTVRTSLDVDTEDPGVRGMPERLRSLESRIDRVASELDEVQRGVGTYVATVEALDVAGRGLRLPLFLLAGRLAPAFLARGVARVPPQGLQGLLRGFERTLVRAAVGQVTNVLRRSGRFALDAAQEWGPTLSRAFDTYVRDPLGRLKNWIVGQWRRVTGAFEQAWDDAYAKFRTIVSKIRDGLSLTFQAAHRVVGAVVGAPVSLVRGLLTLPEQFGRIFGTTFVTVPKNPDAHLDRTVEYTGEMHVRLPLDEVLAIPVELRFSPSGSVKYEYYDDGTVEVTLDQRLAAEVALGYATSGLLDAGVEHALGVAFGGDVMYRIPAGSEDVFVQQFVGRRVLQALSVAADPVVRFAATMALRRMAPEPSPNSSSTYVSTTSRSSLKATFGGTGLGLEAGTEVEGRTVVDHDAHTTTLEVSSTIDWSEHASFMGISSTESGQEAKTTFSIELDARGLPTTVTTTAEVRSSDAVSGSVFVHSASETVERIQTATNTVAITPEHRAHIAALAGDLPGSGSALVAELQSIASGGEVSVHSREELVRTESVAVDAKVIAVEGTREERHVVKDSARPGGAS